MRLFHLTRSSTRHPCASRGPEKDHTEDRAPFHGNDGLEISGEKNNHASWNLTFISRLCPPGHDGSCERDCVAIPKNDGDHTISCGYISNKPLYI